MSCLFSLVFVSLTISAVSSQPFEVERKWEDLCHDKSVELVRISEVKALIEYVKSSEALGESSGCKPEVRESLLALERVVSDSTEDVCTPEKVAQIGEFHSRFIASSEGPRKSSHLARSLRNFFLAFGLRVSGICKRTMINSLLTDSQEQLNENDARTIELWAKNEDSMINRIVGNPNDFDDVLLASELNRFVASDGGQGGGDEEKLFIQTATGKVIQKIKLVCGRRFKPFYQRLILPLVDLSNMGYNYQGEELERELEELRTNADIHNWFKIVYLCESVSNVEILDDPAGGEVDQQVVRILNQDEVEAIKREHPELGQPSAELLASVGDQIVYEPNYGDPMEDLVLNPGNKQMAQMIKSFDDKKTANDRIRDRLLRKMGAFIKEKFLKGGMKIVGSFLRGQSESETGSAQSGEASKETVVRAIDRFVNEKSRSESGDVAVAGAKDYAKRLYHHSVYLGPNGIGKKISKKTIGRFDYGKWFWRVMGSIIFGVGVILMLSAMG